MTSGGSAHVGIGNVTVSSRQSRTAMTPIAVDEIHTYAAMTSAWITGTLVHVDSAILTCPTPFATAVVLVETVQGAKSTFTGTSKRSARLGICDVTLRSGQSRTAVTTKSINHVLAQTAIAVAWIGCAVVDRLHAVITGETRFTLAGVIRRGVPVANSAFSKTSFRTASVRIWNVASRPG